MSKAQGTNRLSQKVRWCLCVKGCDKVNSPRDWWLIEDEKVWGWLLLSHIQLLGNWWRMIRKQEKQWLEILTEGVKELTEYFCRGHHDGVWLPYLEVQTLKWGWIVKWGSSVEIYNGTFYWIQRMHYKEWTWKCEKEPGNWKHGAGAVNTDEINESCVSPVASKAWVHSRFALTCNLLPCPWRTLLLEV